MAIIRKGNGIIYGGVRWISCRLSPKSGMSEVSSRSIVRAVLNAAYNSSAFEV